MGKSIKKVSSYCESLYIYIIIFIHSLFNYIWAMLYKLAAEIPEQFMTGMFADDQAILLYSESRFEIPVHSLRRICKDCVTDFHIEE